MGAFGTSMKYLFKSIFHPRETVKELASSPAELDKFMKGAVIMKKGVAVVAAAALTAVGLGYVAGFVAAGINAMDSGSSFPVYGSNVNTTLDDGSIGSNIVSILSVIGMLLALWYVLKKLF